MSKKQIRLTQEGIRKMISEAIKSYSFNGEGFNDESDDKFDINGNPRYPEGAFSTDSEEGEAFKERAKNHVKGPKDDDSMIWNQRERRLKDVKDSITGENWADTIGSLNDTGNKFDKLNKDEYGDEEAENQLYDKPFGDLDDVENQWADEPGYEEKSEGDDDDNIAGLSEGKVTLSEEGLRKFVSYSVAKLLKEGNLGTTVHFNGDSSFKPENPYKDMSWDEYCEAKRRENEEDQMKAAPSADKKPNLGVTTHFDGSEKPERNPEDDKHLFDDQYWVDKMKLSKDDLQEMVRKALTGVMKRLG